MSDTAASVRPTTQTSPLWIVLFRTAALLALMASAALYVQYLDPGSAAFCGLHSGCEAVRKSGFSYFGSRFLSIPLVGLVAYAVVLGASVLLRQSRLPLRLATAGAVFALLFLATQAFYVNAFCWLCVVVDTSAIFAALFALGARRNPDAVEPLRAWTWTALAGLAVMAPAAWAALKPAPPVPSSIRALYEPGKINVVEFGDFECPFCRAFHPVLQSVVKSYAPGEVNFVRKHVPLQGHPDALPAARADVCAEAQGKGELLADRLVDMELSPSANRRAAIEVGVDGSKLDQCLASSVPDVRIDADTKLLTEVGMEGLPTTYVEGKRLLGAVSETVVRDAFEAGRRGKGLGGVPGPLFAVCLLFAVAGVVWLGRSSRGII